MENNFRDSYVDFLTATFNCEISAMNAENKQREIQGESMAYTEESFAEAAKKYNKLLDKHLESLNKRRK